MTMHTLADLCFVLGYVIELHTSPAHQVRGCTAYFTASAIPVSVSKQGQAEGLGPYLSISAIPLAA
jgi:hypothetical protein